MVIMACKCAHDMRKRRSKTEPRAKNMLAAGNNNNDGIMRTGFPLNTRPFSQITQVSDPSLPLLIPFSGRKKTSILSEKKQTNHQAKETS